MILIEALIAGIGATVAKSTLKLWLEDDSAIVDAAGNTIADLLSKKVPDVLSRRKTERTFDEIRDLSADSIEKMLHKETEGVDESRLRIISNAAAETLSNTPIDIELLVGRNLDKDRLVNYLLERTGAQGGNPALAGKDTDNKIFPEAEQVIYRRVLSHASQLIVDMSSSFPKFDAAVSSELLKRTESMAEQVIEGMNRIVNDQSDAFEADYRSACVRRWDHLELFGVDLNETNRRYNLSVAYVTLMIERLSVDSEVEENQVDIRDSMQADEALSQFERLFVRGPAGSGKTTLLQWFAVFAAARRLEGNLAELNGCVPFLIKLRNFSDSELPAPEDFPKEASTAIAGNMPDRWVHEKLQSGNALILVDGLDEVAEVRRGDVRRWLNDLTESFPKSRFLITSRPHAAEEGWLNTDKFIDAELQDMGLDDTHEFIEHWHAAVAETTNNDNEKLALQKLSDSLKSKLLKNAAICRLATSPLLCALLCALHRQRIQNLPSDRIELYDLCIEMFMRRDEERSIDATDYVKLGTRQKESLLQNFAWWMIRNEKTTATPTETINCFQRHSKRLNRAPEDCDGKAVTKLFMQRIGIIRQLAHQKIDFPHRTFQEYLAAKAAIEEDDLGTLVKNAHNDQWREVVILAAGLLSPKRASALILELLARGDSAEEYHSLYLVSVAALDLLVAGEENSEIEVKVAERLSRIVPPKNIAAATQLAIAGDLVVPHLEYRKMMVKEAAASIRTLALIGSESAHNTLKAYAVDSRHGVRQSIVQSIKFARNPTGYMTNVFGHLTKLTSLDISGFKIRDITPLSTLTNLISLNLSNTPVSNISSLETLTKLTSLNLSGTKVIDIRSIANLPNLTTLDLRETQVTDFRSIVDIKNLRILV
ncbi:NACHT domain-containing protein [Leucothrix arctica]|uniref:NACHT domain-containing protein n=1 Tax=Leucothrix arctica TaxID=1481894 RepID=A0A317C8Z3_9GAMM|nr:NACHT domain-containing protein [Leucothrix arctica]PWQ95145.1 hypothetical protein DKT75_12405 [Leucothrix arctica]